MLAGLEQLVHIQAGIPDGALEGGHQGFGGGLGGAAGQRGQGGIDDIHAGLGRHQVDHVAGAGGVVGVQMDGHLDIGLELLHQGIGVIGQQQVGHVLDADGIRAHLLDLLGQLDEVLLVMHGADGVADAAFHPAAGLFDGLHGPLDVAGIIQGVEDAHHVDAVFDGFLAEGVHHVVGIVLVAQQVLAAQQHLQLGIGHMLAQLAQPLPGILVQEAHAAVKGGAAPALQGPVADAVQDLAGGQHILQAHAGGSLGLMRVTQDGIGNLKDFLPYIYLPYRP